MNEWIDWLINQPINGVNEWMNQWMREWMNEWMNQWNEWINEWINRMNQWMEWVNEWINRMNESIIQSINQPSPSSGSPGNGKLKMTGSGSSGLSNFCLASIGSYSSTETSVLWLVLTLTIDVAFPWSHNQNSGSWRPSCICDSCRMWGGYLWPSQLA